VHFIEISVYGYTNRVREISVDEAIVLFVEMDSLCTEWQEYRPLENGAEI
jgi:hypothetical protein